MRKVSIISPAFPGGRFSGAAFPARALVSKVSNGSRRTGALSAAGFSAVDFPESAAVFAPSLAAAALPEALAGALAAPLEAAGAAGFAGGAGFCGAAAGAADPPGALFSWSRTMLGWIFGWSCAMAQAASTAERTSGNRVRDDFANRIVSRLDSTYLVTGGVLPGVLPAGAGVESIGLLKKVVTVHLPSTVVPGRTGYLDLVGSGRPVNVRSPTLMIRERRLSREKKSSMLKYGPSTLIWNGSS